MENHNDSRPGNGEDFGIVIAGRTAPYLSGVLPRDFPQRLERLREASGLTWNAFADALGLEDFHELFKLDEEEDENGEP